MRWERRAAAPLRSLYEAHVLQAAGRVPVLVSIVQRLQRLAVAGVAGVHVHAALLGAKVACTRACMGRAEGGGV